MPGFASLLVTASAAIVVVLSLLHFLYTFRGDKLHPREPGTMQAMRQSGLMLTRQTTVWRAWIGFNVSHSFGLLLFGLLYGYLALTAPGLLFGSLFLRALGIALLAGWIALSRMYFFRAPYRAVAAAAALYVAGLTAAAF